VYETAALDVAVNVGVVDALLEAPDVARGLSVAELQSKLDVDAAKLAIILRLLATKGWFHETSEGVFAVTRPSLQLSKGKNGWKTVLYVGYVLLFISSFNCVQDTRETKSCRQPIEDAHPSSMEVLSGLEADRISTCS